MEPPAFSTTLFRVWVVPLIFRMPPSEIVTQEASFNALSVCRDKDMLPDEEGEDSLCPMMETAPVTRLSPVRVREPPENV